MFGKLKCKNCGTTNDKNSKYCSECGNVLSNAVCNACGSEVSPADQFCPNCGSKLNQPDESRRSHETVLPQEHKKIKMWSRGPLDFAKRVDVVDIKGTFNKNITVEQGTKALFLQGGRFTGELFPGTYNVGGLIQKIEHLVLSEKATVILVDGSDVRIKVDVSGLRTSESLNVGVRSEIVLNLSDAILFFNNVMKGRESMATTDLEDFLRNEILNILQPEIMKYSFDSLYGNEELKSKIQQDLHYKLQTTLERSGLKIIHVPYLDYDESEWDEINKQKSRIGKESAGLKLDSLSEDVEDDRLEIRNRARQRATLESMEELQNNDDFAGFEHESTKTSMDRDNELKKLGKSYSESMEDYDTARKRTIESDDQKHRHGLDSVRVEHDLGIKTQLTDGEMASKRTDDDYSDERRLKDQDMDVRELDQLLDIKAKKDDMKLKNTAGYQDLETERIKAQADLETQKLADRSKASAEALISMTDGHQSLQLTELAKMKNAQALTEEQLMALSAKDSAGVADALKAKYSSEHDKKLYEERLEDQSKFLDKMEYLSDKSADRAERMSMKSMEQMGLTASTRAAAASNTTVVSGGGESGQPIVIGEQGVSNQKEIEKVVVCRECNQEVPLGTQFCTNCGEKI